MKTNHSAKYVVVRKKGKYLVAKLSALKTYKYDCLIDEFSKYDKALEVAESLNEGYFYSKEFGIECYMEQSERLFNAG